VAKGSTTRKKPAKPKDTTLTIRCTPAWRAWIEKGARHCRTDASKLIEGAVADLLKARGFNEKEPDRIAAKEED
jgi:hypothetical protein